MKIAIISDIHGNLEALKSVLQDIKENSVDKIICLGDTIGKGVNSHACIELVRKYCDVVLMGNTDTRFCDDPKNFEDNEVEHSRIIFNQSLLTDNDREFLTSLPFSEEFYFSGYLIRLFHAHPTSCFKFINDYDKSFRDKYTMFEPSEHTKSNRVADIVIYGHLHYPFMQKLYNRTLICTGSVGNNICTIQNDEMNASPNEATSAHYVIITGEYNSRTHSAFSVETRSVPYNIQKELKSNVGINPEYEAYETELTLGRYRDMQRIEQLYIDRGYEL